MSGFKIGDVVLVRRYAGGAAFVGRVSKYDKALFGVAEAHGPVSWRAASELERVGAKDRRLLDFLRAEERRRGAAS